MQRLIIIHPDFLAGGERYLDLKTLFTSPAGKNRPFLIKPTVIKVCPEDKPILPGAGLICFLADDEDDDKLAFIFEFGKLHPGSWFRVCSYTKDTPFWITLYASHPETGALSVQRTHSDPLESEDKKSALKQLHAELQELEAEKLRKEAYDRRTAP